MVFCVLFRLGLGVALLFAREVSEFVGGDELDFPPRGGAMRSSPGLIKRSPGLPGLVRIWRGGWSDLLSDWCCGVSLMIGESISTIFRVTSSGCILPTATPVESREARSRSVVVMRSYVSCEEIR